MTYPSSGPPRGCTLCGHLPPHSKVVEAVLSTPVDSSCPTHQLNCPTLLMCCLQGDYVMAIDRDTVIDAAAWVAATDSFHPVHMNHSRNRPNVVRYYERAAGRVAFFTTRDIQPGEELLFNYGAAYWKGREHLELP